MTLTTGTHTVRVTADYGDSGGPVYYGGTAFGYFTGSPFVGGQVRDAFSQANQVPNAIAGWRVRTH
ncbi:hypothetical protein GCM10027589_05960 [Actinocorallia lasiicapitis]